jgi:hypothetical protein
MEDLRHMILSYSSSMSRSVLLTSPFLPLNRLGRLYDENDQIRELSRYVLGLVNAKQQAYSIYMEESELAVPEVVVMSIRDERTICFHIAITYTNADMENAKAVCSQAVLYNSTENDAYLYFAVYDCFTQMGCFCLLDPKEQTYEDVAQFQRSRQEMQVAERLQAYVASNAEALQ